MCINSRIAAVTGGNRGLGLETCRKLSSKGFRVILASRNKIKGEFAAQQLKKEGLDVFPFKLDVTIKQDIINFVDFISTEHGHIDVLVNNAGVLLDTGKPGFKQPFDILNIEADIFRNTMETNVYEPLGLIQAVAPLMKKQNYGRIVNVSSGLGLQSNKDNLWPAYSMSKAALNFLTRFFSTAFKDYDILVNAVCPGWVRTDMGGEIAPIAPAEGADTIVWLTMLQNRGVTGSFFRDRQQIEW